MIAPVIRMDGKRQTAGCSFCCKNDEEVRVILRGEMGTICDECIFRCVSILEEKGIILEGQRAPVEALSSPSKKEGER